MVGHAESLVPENPGENRSRGEAALAIWAGGIVFVAGRLTFSSLDAPLRRPSAVVVAKDPLVRSGLVAVLSAYPGLVLKEAATVAGAKPNADVVVWDAPDASHGLTEARVLALVDDAPGARRALSAGARGALSRGATAESLAPAAVAIAAGHFVIDEQFAKALLELDAPQASTPGLLSPRENQVLELLSEGLSNREIAARLGVSRHTAKFHVNGILDKMGAETRTEAVVLAARSGLLSL